MQLHTVTNIEKLGEKVTEIERSFKVEKIYSNPSGIFLSPITTPTITSFSIYFQKCHINVSLRLPTKNLIFPHVIMIQALNFFPHSLRPESFAIQTFPFTRVSSYLIYTSLSPSMF